MKRRAFLALASMAVLAACEQPAVAPKGQTDNYYVQKVNVDLSKFEGVKGRQIQVPKAKVQKDLSDALTRELQAASAGRTQPVIVNLSLLTAQLVSPGQAALVGGVSTFTGVLNVQDAKSGEVLVPATEVFGNAEGYAPGGIIAVALSKTPQKDYEATVAGFAADIRKSLFPATK